MPSFPPSTLGMQVRGTRSQKRVDGSDRLHDDLTRVARAVLRGWGSHGRCSLEVVILTRSVSRTLSCRRRRRRPDSTIRWVPSGCRHDHIVLQTQTFDRMDTRGVATYIGESV